MTKVYARRPKIASHNGSAKVGIFRTYSLMAARQIVHLRHFHKHSCVEFSLSGFIRPSNLVQGSRINIIDFYKQFPKLRFTMKIILKKLIGVKYIMQSFFSGYFT